MDLSFGVDEDSAEKKYETSEGEDSGCQKLQVELHNVGFERNRMQICTRFWRFCKFLGLKNQELLIYHRITGIFLQ